MVETKVIVTDTFIHQPKWLEEDHATALFSTLVNETLEKCRSQMSYGRYGPRPNKMKRMGRFGDPGMSYVYKGKKKPIYEWTPGLLKLRDLVEDEMKLVRGYFNCGVINAYLNETADLYPHTDITYLPQLGQEPIIPAVSLGETRGLILRPIDAKPKDNRDLLVQLGHGDLFVMRGKSQLEWKHGIAPSLEKKEMRLSITFRRHLDVVKP